MPYIKKYQRDMLDKEIDILVGAMERAGKAARECDCWTAKPELQGLLNYVVTRIIDKMIGGELRYSKVNDAVGALECCKMELYRRLAAPYEDQKIEENGDAYIYSIKPSVPEDAQDQ